jgi:hypothetical protein
LCFHSQLPSRSFVFICFFACSFWKIISWYDVFGSCKIPFILMCTHFFSLSLHYRKKKRLKRHKKDFLLCPGRWTNELLEAHDAGLFLSDCSRSLNLWFGREFCEKKWRVEIFLRKVENFTWLRVTAKFHHDVFHCSKFNWKFFSNGGAGKRALIFCSKNNNNERLISLSKLVTNLLRLPLKCTLSQTRPLLVISSFFPQNNHHRNKNRKQIETYFSLSISSLISWENYEPNKF